MTTCNIVEVAEAAAAAGAAITTKVTATTAAPATAIAATTTTAAATTIIAATAATTIVAAAATSTTTLTTTTMPTRRRRAVMYMLTNNAYDMAVSAAGVLALCWLGVCMGVRGVLGDPVCQHNLQYTTANCSGHGLDRVPWGLHHNLDTLDLCNNRFSSLEPNAFKSYANLRVLRLCHNAIRNLHHESLAKLTRLHSLDLAANLLSSVPTEVLKTLPSLLRLDLAANNLVSIPDEAFVGLPNLKVLDLSNNRITTLEPSSLLGLSNLRVLKLENNALRWLSPTIFEHLSGDLLQVHLYNNPWLCDCKVRRMRQWMGNGTSDVWQQPGQAIRCDGPSMARGKALSSIPLDELACRVEMRTSGSTQTVNRGEEAMMECIYFSIPAATPIWHRNQVPINFASNPRKYVMTVEGSPVTVTRLYVRDFQYTDITEYECFAHNVRGSDSTVFKVTLKGIPFDSVSQTPPASPRASLGLDSKSIVVGVAVVCGIILVTVFSLLIYYCVRHFRRQEQEKQDAVVESVKKHFLTSDEVSSTDRSKLEQFDEAKSDSNRIKDTTTVQGKQARVTHDREPLYTFEQSGSPFTSGNTYVSFSTEVIEPEVIPMYPQARTSKYEESQAESKTPLLNRGTPSASDADDSVDDSMQSHVYESITVYRNRRSQQYSDGNSSVHSQPRTTPSTPLGSASTGHPDYQDYREIRQLGHTGVAKKESQAAKKGKNTGSAATSEQRKSSPSTAETKECIEMVSQDATSNVSHETSGSEL